MMRQIVRVVLALAFIGTPAMARGADTNAAVVAFSGTAPGFANCRIEVEGVYTQAELRVAVWIGVSGMSGDAPPAAAPEPGIDRNRGGGAASPSALDTGRQPLPALPESDPARFGELARESGLPGSGAGAPRGAGFGASPGRWGWLAEGVRQERERRMSERLRPPLPAFSPTGDPFDPSVPSRGAAGASPFLPGDGLMPAAPLAPSPYLGDDFNGGMR